MKESPRPESGSQQHPAPAVVAPVRFSILLLLALGAAAAMVGLQRVGVATTGSPRANAYAIMALAGFGLIASLLAVRVVSRARRASLPVLHEEARARISG